MPEQMRTQILDALAAGEHLSEVARSHGITTARIWGRAQWDENWAQLVDAALTTGRDPNLNHGTEAGYRKRCRCPECRAAHTH